MKNFISIKTIIFSFLFIYQISFCQLANFTLAVDKIDETCTANGILNFNVLGISPGASIVYNIYKLPDVTTPISITTANSLNNLASGSYKIKAIQSLGTLTNFQEQNIVILNQIVPLAYSLAGTNSSCGNNGQIAVYTTSGTAVNYEIIAGPMLRPLQTNNNFIGLAAGQYTIRVFDNCGEGVVQTFTLGTSIPGLNLGTISSNSNCTSTIITYDFLAALNTVISYPLVISFTVNPPVGPPIIYNQTIFSSGANGATQFVQTIALIAGQTATYSLQVTDGCGNIYNQNGIFDNASSSPTSIISANCATTSFTISNVFSITMTSAPTAFPTALPYNYTSQIIGNAINFVDLPVGNYQFTVTNYCGISSVMNITPPVTRPGFSIISTGCVNSGFNINYVQALVLTAAPASFPLALPQDYTSQLILNSITINNIPSGNYVFNVIDLCGIPRIMNITLSTQTASSPAIFTYPGCTPDVGSVNIFGTIIAVKIIAAPTTYPNPLPFNLGSLITSSGLSIDNLPVGNYTFQLVNNCNVISTRSINIVGFQTTISNINIIQNCGSFDIDLNYSSNGVGTSFWLQKLNPVTNDWGNPLTGAVYADNTYPNTVNSIQLQNNSITYNFAYTGDFRILMPSYYASDYCYKIIKTFTYSGLSKINNVYSFSCNNNKFDVIVDASGIGNLIYRITTKNGQPFLVQNGNSNIFLGLDAGSYNFQVQDSCGNVVNSQFSIPQPLVFGLTASSFCPNQTSSLTVPNIPFLQYEWWKDNNTTTILSTTNSLIFTNFNAAINGGIYHVRVKYLTNPNSCINFVLDYTISPIPNIPNAGQDNLLNYCGNAGIINLNSLLIGTVNSGGTWSETSSSGVAITANTWDSSNVTAGNYQFKYLVTSTCNASDESFINIIIKPKPNVPTITANANYCIGENISLSVNSTAGANYTWTGPNGFSSTIQNPTITNCTTQNSGLYIVTVALNGCSLTTNKTLIINSLGAPNAGLDSTTSYCGTQGIINLTSLILGNFDTGGTWTEITNSGILIFNNNWNSTFALVGNYQFMYKVNSSCGTTDESIINILIKNIPAVPVINVNSNVCTNDSIQFSSNLIIGANYSWTGPNGFLSNLQSPTIIKSQVNNSGTYSLQISLNGCTTTSNVTIIVRNPIEFELIGNCTNGKFTVVSNPINNSYNANTAIYNWSGPNNFASNENSIFVTDSKNLGNYTLQITNVDGCIESKTINVLNNLCFIQQGISPNNDNSNENFDLTSYGGNLQVEIFNRYGMLVFDQNNYTNQWHGQDYNNNLLPDATYFYCIKPEMGETKVGWIYLLKEIK